HHVGFTATIAADAKPALTKRLEALVAPPGFDGRAPGGPSRWSSERSAEWLPLKPRLVVEVEYDHVTQDRFHHGTKLIRWRPDKAPHQCRMDQIRTRTSGSAHLLHGPGSTGAASLAFFSGMTAQSLPLARQAALVTAAATGIGRATALRLAAGGKVSDYVTGTTLVVDGGMSLYPGFATN